MLGGGGAGSGVYFQIIQRVDWRIESQNESFSGTKQECRGDLVVALYSHKAVSIEESREKLALAQITAGLIGTPVCFRYAQSCTIRHTDAIICG